MVHEWLWSVLSITLISLAPRLEKIWMMETRSCSNTEDEHSDAGKGFLLSKIYIPGLRSFLKLARTLSGPEIKISLSSEGSDFKAISYCLLEENIPLNIAES